MHVPQGEGDTGWRRFWQAWVKPLIIVIAIVSTFRSAIADWNDVPTQSMEPSILVGDRIFVNKLAYDLKVPFTTWPVARWSQPQVGDIVVFFHPQTGKRMVKRVLGTPGDRVQMLDNALVINGERVTYQPASLSVEDQALLTDPGPYGFMSEQLGGESHPVMTQPRRRSRRSFSQVTVPRGQYLMLGDNRDNSGDWRVFGFVDENLIMGEVVGLAFSLDHDRYHMPRWQRFFRAVP